MITIEEKLAKSLEQMENNHVYQVDLTHNELLAITRAIRRALGADAGLPLDHYERELLKEILETMR